MTARAARRVMAACHVLSVLISAACAVAAGVSLLAFHVVAGPLGWAAAAAVTVMVYAADRWVCRHHLVSRWIIPRRWYQ